jgi:hypothetical protein
VYKLWRGGVLDPSSDPTKPSLCERLQAEGDAGVGIATWFVCFYMEQVFLDFLEALEFFFAYEPQGLDTVIFLSLASFRPFVPGDAAAKLSSFKRVIQGTRQLVMFLSTWDKPDALRRAWCMWELFVCFRCGGRVEFVFPRLQRVRLMEVMRSNPAAFLDSISFPRSESSTSRFASEQDELHAAISAEMGFSGLDAMVRRALGDWMERLLRAKIEEARVAGKEEEAAGFIKALGTFHSD